MTTVKLVFSLECGAGAKPQPGPVQQMAALPRKERLAAWRRESLRNPLWIKLNMFFCVNTVTEKRPRWQRLFLSFSVKKMKMSYSIAMRLEWGAGACRQDERHWSNHWLMLQTGTGRELWNNTGRQRHRQSKRATQLWDSGNITSLDPGGLLNWTSVWNHYKPK